MSATAEQHLKTANAEMVGALTKSSEIVAQNSAILEQIYQRLGADSGREVRRGERT
jgi:F0F1-type ATP synthase membrane subunit b/b'